MAGFARQTSFYSKKYSAAFQQALEPLENRLLLSAWMHQDQLIILGTEGNDMVTISRDTNPTLLKVTDNGVVSTFVEANIRQINVLALAGNDRIAIDQSAGRITTPMQADGGDGFDTLIGGAGNDTLYGGRNGDQIVGGDGDDLIRAGWGHDRILGDGGNDTIYGGPDNDTIQGGAGNNTIDGGAGINLINQDTGFHPNVNVDSSRRTGDPFVFINDVDGYTPGQIRNAYNFPTLNSDNLGQGQTIAIVDAFHSPTVLYDLTAFSYAFGLPFPDVNTNSYFVNSVGDQVFPFRVVYNTATGATPMVDEGWAAEIALDVQWAHAIAPRAKIVLVEAESNYNSDLFAAVQRATNIVNADGGGVVSMSFGGPEYQMDSTFYSQLRSLFGANRSISYIASAGDQKMGEPICFPATSPYVTAIGGTFLPLDSQGNRIGSETGWISGGGGISEYESVPGYQQGVIVHAQGYAPTSTDSIGFRVGPDVSYNADPASGVAVFNTTPLDGFMGWSPYGGTSAGAPQFAGLVALANEMRKRAGKGTIGASLNASLYEMARFNRSDAYRDIVQGGNGFWGADSGFDPATGWGTPVANTMINLLAASGPSAHYITTPIEWNAVVTKPFYSDTLAKAAFRVGTGFIDGGDRLNLKFDAPPEFSSRWGDPINTVMTVRPMITVDRLVRRSDNSIYGTGSASYEYIQRSTGGTAFGANLLKFTGYIFTDGNGIEHINGSFVSVDLHGNDLNVNSANGPVIEGEFQG